MKSSPGQPTSFGAKLETKSAVGVGPKSTVIEMVLLSISQLTPLVVAITFLLNSVVTNKAGGWKSTLFAPVIFVKVFVPVLLCH